MAFQSLVNMIPVRHLFNAFCLLYLLFFAGGCGLSETGSGMVIREAAFDAIPESRGIWISDPRNLDWETVVREVGRAGLNTIFVNFATAGTAFYPSGYLPVQKMYHPLRELVEIAHAADIRIYAKFICFFPWMLPAETREGLFATGLIQRDPGGMPVVQNGTPWLDPANLTNRSVMIHVIDEVLSGYQVDGIQLDYIRYESLRGFDEAELKVRSQSLTGFVREVSTNVRRRYPGVLISAAVMPDPVRAVSVMGQDWHAWASECIVDELCTMDYSDDQGDYTNRIVSRSRRMPADFPVSIGIGMYKMRNAGQLMRQVRWTRRNNPCGFALFSYTPAFAETYMPALSRELKGK